MICPPRGGSSSPIFNKRVRSFPFRITCSSRTTSAIASSAAKRRATSRMGRSEKPDSAAWMAGIEIFSDPIVSTNDSTVSLNFRTEEKLQPQRNTARQRRNQREGHKRHKKEIRQIQTDRRIVR